MSAAALSVRGATPDGLRVVAGAWTLVATHGIPLDVVLRELRDRGAIPSWLDLMTGMLNDHVAPNACIARIAAAMSDAGFEDNMRVEVERRLCDEVERVR